MEELKRKKVVFIGSGIILQGAKGRLGMHISVVPPGSTRTLEEAEDVFAKHTDADCLVVYGHPGDGNRLNTAAFLAQARSQFDGPIIGVSPSSDHQTELTKAGADRCVMPLEMEKTVLEVAFGK